MSASAVAHSRVALPTLERLYEREGLPAFDLPAELSEAYGGPLGFAEPRVYANFVTMVGCDLLTLRHAGSQLFARYRCRLSGREGGQRRSS